MNQQPENPGGQPEPQPVRLAVLLSGGGRTLQNLVERIEAGSLAARVTVVISSRGKAYGVERAKKLGMPVHVVERRQFNSPAEFSDVVWPLVDKAGADLVCLAGFLSLLTIPPPYRRRMLNVHPALLPSFGGPGMYGHHVHEAVLAHGCKVSGCTVHLCDDQYDTGPILVQRTCPVLESDTADSLADRVFEEECRAYPRAIELMAAGRVRTEGRRATILPWPAERMVAAAARLCEIAHAGQLGADGKPYATHPAAVADILRGLGWTDPAILAAAYLHDVLEDTDVGEDHLDTEFGPQVTQIVRQLTVPACLEGDFDAKQRWQVEHAPAMSPEAKLVKLADRAHNLEGPKQTWPAGKQHAYGEYTLKVLEAMKPWPSEDLARRVKSLAESMR